jgi:hypothetical protein
MANSDIVLTHADGSSNRVEIPLTKNEGLPGGWNVQTVSIAPESQSTDAVNYQSISPDRGLVLDQQTWNRGFGESKNDFGSHGSLGRYGYTDGTLAMFENEVSLAYQQDEVDVFVRNGRFEWESTDDDVAIGWAGTAITSGTESIPDDQTPRSGKRCLQIITSGTGNVLSNAYHGALSANTLGGKTVTFSIYARRVSGTGTAKARIKDSAGETNGSTSASDAYTLLTVTREINSGASTLSWEVEFSASGDKWVLDDAFVTPAGNWDFPGNPQEFNGNFYIAAGRSILKWNETYDCWYSVYTDPSFPITGLRAFSELGTTSVLIAGRAELDAYLRSTTGAADSWAEPTNAGDNAASEGSLFAVLRNANGDFALMKSRGNNAVSMSVDTSDVVNWGQEMQVGSSDRAITNIFESNDTVYIGKEDGLYVYDRTINLFRDIEPEANFFADQNNFSAGMARGGSLFATGGDQAFWQITPSNYPYHHWVDSSHLFRAWAFHGFGGRVSAVTNDRHNMWVALADNLSSNAAAFPYNFPLSFTTSGLSNSIKLISVRTWRDKDSGATEQVAHTMSSLDANAVTSMGRHTTADQSSLFVFGTAINDDISSTDNSEPRIARIRIPLDNENPRSNAKVEVQKRGYFYTPYIDFNFPDVDKAASKLTLQTLNLAAGEKTLTVHYKIDDATADDASGWTLWGDDGVFDTSPEETKAADLTSASALVTFKRIRFRFQFDSDEHNEAPPTLLGLVFHAVWNPTESRIYRAITKLSDQRSLQLRRRRRTSIKDSDLTNLETLRQQAFCILTDPENNSVKVKLRYTQTRVAQKVDTLRSRNSQRTDLIELQMDEVRTT